LLALCGMAAAQTVPAGWKIIKADKAACQAAIPPEWMPGSEPGTAHAKDMLEGMAVVTSDIDRLQPTKVKGEIAKQIALSIGPVK